MKWLISVLLILSLLSISGCSYYVDEGEGSEIANGMQLVAGLVAPQIAIGPVAINMIVDTRIHGVWYHDDDTKAMEIFDNNLMYIYSDNQVYLYPYVYFGTSAIIGNPYEETEAFGMQFVFPEPEHPDLAIVFVYGNGDFFLMHKQIMQQETALDDTRNR